MNFDQAFERLIGHEGVLSNDPRDPGGLTKYGISERSYPGVNVAALTLDEAKAIYLRDFWAPLPDIPGAAKFQLFDVAVNSGVRTALKMLQRAIGVTDDGVFGPISQAALGHFDDAALALLLGAERLDFWTALPTWPAFGKGWARRGAQNLRYAAKDL